jgi:hypothetical protein
MAEEERDEVLPESNLEVVILSPEIQDAEPIPFGADVWDRHD